MSTTTVTETTTTRGLPALSLDPPPYTPPPRNFFNNADEDDEEEPEPSITFTIHAPTTVHGSNNIIAIPPPDVARLTAAMIGSISQKLNLARNINVQINCGVSVIGDKNIVGNPAIRPLLKQQPAVCSLAAASDDVVTNNLPALTPTHETGKRKASEVCEHSMCEI